MSNAPDRIWAWGEHAGDRGWHDEPADEWTEYIRTALFESESQEYVLAQINADLRARIEELEKAICAVSHHIGWIGEKDSPGWCLGCGKHRSLIREAR